MAQVSYPGVYIQEKPSGLRTIVGVATSIAAFFGRASKGPINKAVRLLSLSDYVRSFGEPHPRSDLADSVRLFFQNGGTDCYVVRLARNARPAAITLHRLGVDTSDTNLPVTTDVAVLRAVAKAAGDWGNTVRLEVSYNTPSPDDTFHLRIIHEAGGLVVTSEEHVNLSMNPTSPRFAPTFVSNSSNLINLFLDSGLGDPDDPVTFRTEPYNDPENSFSGFSQSRRPLGELTGLRATLDALINPADPETIPRSQFHVSINGSPPALVDLAPWSTIGSATLSEVADHFVDRIQDAVRTVVPGATVSCDFVSEGDVENMLTVTVTSGDTSSVRISRAPANDIAAALMLGVEQGGIEATRWSNFRPAPTATLLTLGDPNPGGSDTEAKASNRTTRVNQIADLNQEQITNIDIDGVSVMLDGTGPSGLTLQTTGATEKFFQSRTDSTALHDNNDGVREKLRIMAQAINAEPGLTWRAEVWGYHLALLARSGTANTRPTSIDTGTTIFDEGLAMNVRQYTLGDDTSDYADVAELGHDGEAPGAGDYFGDADRQTGFHALDSVDLFNLMVLPRDEEVPPEMMMNRIIGPAGIYCKEHRAFLLVDAPSDWTEDGRPAVVQDTTKVDALRALLGSAKDHAAVFYPRLRYTALRTNPSTGITEAVTRSIGPSGAIAGLMARIDVARGVWKAPAGTEATVNSVLGLDVKLTDRENGVLNKKAANCLRVLPSGFVNWGARTLDGSDDSPSEWKYIPVRRLALFIEESLYRGTQWVVFEPNDEPLWAKIRLNVGAFMMSLFRQGAFEGSTPDQAFFVKCDRETTTSNDQQLGIVNIVVGFAPLKPAEFVIITIQQITRESV